MTWEMKSSEGEGNQGFCHWAVSVYIPGRHMEGIGVSGG